MLIFMLTLTTALAANVINIQKIEHIVDETCNGYPGYEIDGVCHDVEIIKTNVDNPYSFAIDHSRDILYFSYYVNNDYISGSAMINLKTKESSIIEQVPGGIYHTVDEDKNEVYIGSFLGVYKYLYDTNTTELVGAKDSDIRMVYYKDGLLYYVLFSDWALNILVNGQSHRHKDYEEARVFHFVIDNEDNSFYTTVLPLETDIYRQRKGTKKIVKFNQHLFEIRGLAVDRNGEVYVCAKEDGVYLARKSTLDLKKVLAVECYAMTFDKDNNMIVADYNTIARFKPVSRDTVLSYSWQLFWGMLGTNNTV